MDGANMNA